MIRDLKTKIGVLQLLEPKDYAHTDTSSSILDMKGFASAVVCVQIGTLTGVDGTNYLTPVLQESDTTADADFKAVDASDIIGTFAKVDATTKDQAVQCVGYKGTKRYVRVLLDYTGTGISASLVGVCAIVGDAGKEPVIAPAAVAAT